jgi:hypothetical protein
MAVEAKAVTRAIALENPYRVRAINFDLLSHRLQSIAVEPGQDEFGKAFSWPVGLGMPVTSQPSHRLFEIRIEPQYHPVSRCFGARPSQFHILAQDELELAAIACLDR